MEPPSLVLSGVIHHVRLVQAEQLRFIQHSLQFHPGASSQHPPDLSVDHRQGTFHPHPGGC